ncbi:DNA-directed DNA polymerase epsilon, subunit B [Thelotrema lepadinum]|nr:DNA-directed DNA polymerase epsilon, subunit B [Thelotrema lepadinum]
MGYDSNTAEQNEVLSSSPAFGTPAYPIHKPRPDVQVKPLVLPVLIPPANLRPLAFRTLTKKYGLTLTSTALQALATFIGKSCGSGWREEGLAEKVLEEVAKLWKRNKGNLIVEGDSQELRDILKILEGSMQGGRLVQQDNPRLQGQLDERTAKTAAPLAGFDRSATTLQKGQDRGSLVEAELNEEEQASQDPRRWLKVVSSFDQPRLFYNPIQKHFERHQKRPSLFPAPSHKTLAFRDRYNLVHQRLLRNESFQSPTVNHPRAHGLQRASSSITQQQAYKLTPIANLLGRGGSTHVLLGLLTTSPTGGLAISDLTGNIALDLSRARLVPENGSWVCPGMVVIVEGLYEQDGSMDGLRLGGGSGVGGTIGGRFIAASVGGPPCERRETSLGSEDSSRKSDSTAGGGFGWVDFLGVGSERACGSKMRVIERSLLKETAAPTGRSRVVCLGELTLDNPKTLEALRQVLGSYAAEKAQDVPMAFVLSGNFVTHAAMAGGGDDGSIAYKENFDLLASTLSEYPTILQASTFIFVPGDNDPWLSSFSKGATAVVPRKGIPELFTSRIRRSFVTANGEAERSPISEVDGEAIWTSNPARISLFGPSQDIALFRDDISGRLRRSAVSFVATEDEQHDIVTRDAALQNQASGTEDSQMEIDLETPGGNFDVVAPSGPTDPDLEIRAARKLVKTILDQGYLSPFPLSSSPVLWDWAGSLQLYPLPSALMLIDAESPPFAVTYEGCHVMNPGRLVADSRKSIAKWIEYDAATRRGVVRDAKF